MTRERAQRLRDVWRLNEARALKNVSVERSLKVRDWLPSDTAHLDVAQFPIDVPTVRFSIRTMVSDGLPRHVVVADDAVVVHPWREWPRCLLRST